MGSINSRPLKAFVRFDGSGRIVAGSLILRKNKPKVGKWKEIQAYECCLTTSSTTLPPPPTHYSFTLSFGETAYDACQFATFDTFYSSVDTIGVGVTLYYDIYLLTPVNNGYYGLSGGTDYTYYIDNGDGIIVTEAEC